MSDLFHITETRLVKSIRSKGLLPGLPSRFDGYEVEPDKSCVYLSNKWGSCPYLAGLGSDDLYTVQGFYSIICIDTRLLDDDLFRPDEDYLRDALNLTGSKARLAVEANAELWADSLTKHHSVAYKGVVPGGAIVEAVEMREDYPPEDYTHEQILCMYMTQDVLKVGA